MHATDCEPVQSWCPKITLQHDNDLRQPESKRGISIVKGTWNWRYGPPTGICSLTAYMKSRSSWEDFEVLRFLEQPTSKYLDKLQVYLGELLPFKIRGRSVQIFILFCIFFCLFVLSSLINEMFQSVFPSYHFAQAPKNICAVCCFLVRRMWAVTDPSNVIATTIMPYQLWRGSGGDFDSLCGEDLSQGLSLPHRMLTEGPESGWSSHVSCISHFDALMAV